MIALVSNKKTEGSIECSIEGTIEGAIEGAKMQTAKSKNIPAGK